MTIDNENYRKQYDGDGVTATFAYDFKIYAAADLVVIVSDDDGVETVKTLNSHYTVTGVGVDGGGNVVFGDDYIPAADEYVTIIQDRDATQDSEWSALGNFSPTTLEEDLDKAVTLIHQIMELTARMPRLRRAITGLSSLDLEIPDPEANKVLMWNPDADGLINAAALDASGVAITSFGEALVALVSIAAARTYLDVYSKAESDALVPSTPQIVRFGPMGEVGTDNEVQGGMAGIAGEIFAIIARVPDGTSATITVKNDGATVYSGLVADTTGVNQASGLANVATGVFSLITFDITGVSGAPSAVYVDVLIQPS